MGNNLVCVAESMAKNFSSQPVRKKSNRGRKAILSELRAEILQKFREGRSNPWIAQWLIHSGRLVRVNQSTVARFRKQILGGKHV